MNIDSFSDKQSKVSLEINESKENFEDIKEENSYQKLEDKELVSEYSNQIINLNHENQEFAGNFEAPTTNTLYINTNLSSLNTPINTNPTISENQDHEKEADEEISLEQPKFPVFIDNDKEYEQEKKDEIILKDLEVIY